MKLAVVVASENALPSAFAVFRGIDPMKTAMAGVKDFAVLILACGLTMSIGAFIAKNIPFDTLLGFAKNLASFMGAVMIPLILAQRQISIAEHTGKEFAKIIMISAATMIIGGLLFTWFPGIKQGVLEFAIVHGLYMMAIGFTLKGFGAMDPKKLLKNAGILMLITVVTAGTLLYGAKVMTDNPSMTGNLVIFTVCLAAYIVISAVNNNIKEKNLAEIEEISYTLTHDSASLDESELNARRIDAIDNLAVYANKGGIVGARANYLCAELTYQQKKYEDAVTYYEATAKKLVKHI